VLAHGRTNCRRSREMRNRHIDWDGIRPIARNIATSLVSDLKSGKLTKLGKDEISAEIITRTIATDGWTPVHLTVLEELTIRYVVEACA
jgi:hypothetical protein